MSESAPSTVQYRWVTRINKRTGKQETISRVIKPKPRKTAATRKLNRIRAYDRSLAHHEAALARAAANKAMTKPKPAQADSAEPKPTRQRKAPNVSRAGKQILKAIERGWLLEQRESPVGVEYVLTRHGNERRVNDAIVEALRRRGAL